MNRLLIGMALLPLTTTGNPTNIIVSNPTTCGANVTWDAGPGDNGRYQILEWRNVSYDHRGWYPELPGPTYAEFFDGNQATITSMYPGLTITFMVRSEFQPIEDTGGNTFTISIPGQFDPTGGCEPVPLVEIVTPENVAIVSGVVDVLIKIDTTQLAPGWYKIPIRLVDPPHNDGLNTVIFDDWRFIYVE